MRKSALALLMVLMILLVAGYAIAAPPAIEEHAPMGILGGIVLFHIGMLIGAIGTLIGAGGGFIVVPILLIFYNFSPQYVIGTSMTVVMLNALSGTFSYILQKRIDYEIGIKFSVAAFPGVFIGALLSQLFSIGTFSIVFGLLLSLLSYSLFFGKEFLLVRSVAEAPKTRRLLDATGQEYTYAPDMAIGISASFFIGVFSGLFGIGGGIIHVPLMSSALGMPVHVATATSHFILAITSFLGVITFIGLQSIDIDYAVVLGIGSIIGANIGANLSLNTHPDIIKKVLALCLFLLALRLVISSLSGP